MTSKLVLLKPSAEYLPFYADALERGWSPDNVRDEARLEQLDEIRADPAAFLRAQDDPQATSGPIRLPDGSLVQRLPGFHRWLWDGEFCGSIGFRWKPGTPELPPTCLGHVGYAVVPWKRGRGYATAALRMLLPEAQRTGLRYVEITTNRDNVASQRVVVANGGVLVERFAYPSQYGAGEAHRYRIALR